MIPVNLSMQDIRAPVTVIVTYDYVSRDISIYFGSNVINVTDHSQGRPNHSHYTAIANVMIPFALYNHCQCNDSC